MKISPACDLFQASIIASLHAAGSCTGPGTKSAMKSKESLFTSKQASRSLKNLGRSSLALVPGPGTSIQVAIAVTLASSLIHSWDSSNSNSARWCTSVCWKNCLSRMTTSMRLSMCGRQTSRSSRLFVTLANVHTWIKSRSGRLQWHRNTEGEERENKGKAKRSKAEISRVIGVTYPVLMKPTQHLIRRWHFRLLARR